MERLQRPAVKIVLEDDNGQGSEHILERQCWHRLEILSMDEGFQEDIDEYGAYEQF